MKNNVVGCEKYSYTDFKVATKVMEDYPSLIYLLKHIIPALKEKAHYTAISDLLKQTEDSKKILEMQYSHYKKVYNRKGKIENEGT